MLAAQQDMPFAACPRRYAAPAQSQPASRHRSNSKQARACEGQGLCRQYLRTRPWNDSEMEG